MTVTDADLLYAVRQNSRLLAAAARSVAPETRVPTCDRWTVAELTGHVAGVQSWVIGVLESRAQEFPGWPEPEPASADPVGAFEAIAAKLQAALEALDPEAPVWNFEGEVGPARWWIRRMAHEAAIHRVDAEAAAGIASRVDPPEVAADGLDEMFSLFAARRARNKRLQTMRGDFHFHTTDTPGEWVIVFGEDGVELRREHAKSSVAVRGPASALLLFAYQRGPADEVEVLGDAGLMDAWREGVRT